MSIVNGTVDLTMEYDHPAETVFAAWSDPKAQLAWGDPGEGWKMEFEQFHFGLGKTDICHFGPVGGPQYLNENRYLVIEPGKRIVYSTTLGSDGRLNFAGTVAVGFSAIQGGSRLRLIEQGLYLDSRDDPTDHENGWSAMLAALDTYLRGRG